jgi:HlyD family secretion protein
VRDGTIEVEVRFKDGVPASARPELNVDAKIVVARVPNALYIERPTNAQPNTVANLFQLQPDADRARRQEVRFGEESGRYIQLTSGARVNDRFIISDTSAYRTEKEIALTD